MIKELRKMRAKGGRDRSVANYVSELQHRGKLRKIITDKGYVAYDTEEFREWKKKAKVGRPIKTEVVKE